MISQVALIRIVNALGGLGNSARFAGSNLNAVFECCFSNHSSGARSVRSEEPSRAKLKTSSLTVVNRGGFVWKRELEIDTIAHTHSVWALRPAAEWI